MRSTCRRDEEAYMERKSGRKDGTSGHGRSVYSRVHILFLIFHSPLKKVESAEEECPCEDDDEAV